MILQVPPFAVLKVRRKGCNALLNIDDSEGTIPVMSTSGVRGDRIGYRRNIASISIRLRNFLKNSWNVIVLVKWFLQMYHSFKLGK